MYLEVTLLRSQELATSSYLNRMNSVCIFSPYFPKIHSDIIFPSATRSSKLSPPLQVVKSPPLVPI